MNTYPRTLKEAIKEIEELVQLIHQLGAKIDDLNTENKKIRSVINQVHEVVTDYDNENDSDNELPF
ncbi:hypothetical protein EDD63_1814 [Breznakia blatticola]|uniref:Uncharacterized protein n=1 Tax=Breznakia blatticola TaxID=1754012 RepID=A0A4R7ZC08_9FIRM|nr:hypothetical protein [Breznakia blatticola]TDW07924.1 hypothetical protein EDD63_1814 [Breznakia blatticola]